MKKIIMALTLSIVMIAQASANEFCDIVLDYAVSVMDSRQSGIGVQKMIEFADENKVSGDLIRMLTMDAYTQSRYDSPAIQKTVIEDFGYKHYLKCIQDTR